MIETVILSLNGKIPFKAENQWQMLLQFALVM